MKREEFLKRFTAIRQQSETLCKPLVTEDYVVQACADVSPPKWHLAHTSWFFETFILKPFNSNYKPFDPIYHYLFNSYYKSIGPAFLRPERGFLARPTVQEIHEYRQAVSYETHQFLFNCSEHLYEKVKPILILGCHHEQQHQELLLMDIKYNFSVNPLFPVYNKLGMQESASTIERALGWFELAGGINTIGHRGRGFCFDNELPAHKVFIPPFCIANRLITNAEYLEFIEDGGYANPFWWLSDGWDWCQMNGVNAPLYWHRIENKWHIFTLHGLKPLDPDEPVAHVSFYEADAYARWRGHRLPREEEWEYFVRQQKLDPHAGNFAENGYYHPLPNYPGAEGQFFGSLWEWTASPYSPYPGFRALPGSIGEYNGKFMNNQRVLRGGCCATPAKHNRSSYRNFFQPEKRWQFSGIRLAADNL